MFEVGKSYKHKNNIHKVWCCTAIGNTLVLLICEGHEFSESKSKCSNYTEYVEPKKFVRYLNINSNGIGGVYNSRLGADSMQSANRIGCKRVEFIEGVYDD